MLRYYSIDLLDLYRGTLSVRRVAALVEGLPHDSSYTQAVIKAIKNSPNGPKRKQASEVDMLNFFGGAVTHTPTEEGDTPKE